MEQVARGNQYLIQVHDDPLRIDGQSWNALLEMQACPTPFMRLEYLQALHASGSAVAETGWAPCFITVDDEGRLVAACPAYLKSHSYGEYVFDWAWADAYRRHGLHYYPKLLCAVPFTPVPGSRLLARDAPARQALVEALQALAYGVRPLSSAHVLFHDDADHLALAHHSWMARQTVQFHWRNRQPQGYVDFADFTASLQREKRKKINQERRRVSDAGIRFKVLQGREIDAQAWDFFYLCYCNTYAAHHSTPYLRRDFFARMAHSLPEHWVMFVAQRGDQAIACSLIAADQKHGHAWGRYWGCVEHVPCLHFEACYYQPLQWCIAQGLQSFEGGAQGEHKMARGLLPVRAQSMHSLADSRFATAVADFLEREGAGMVGYVDELTDRSPFKAEGWAE